MGLKYFWVLAKSYRERSLELITEMTPYVEKLKLCGWACLVRGQTAVDRRGFISMDSSNLRDIIRDAVLCNRAGD